MLEQLTPAGSPPKKVVVKEKVINIYVTSLADCVPRLVFRGKFILFIFTFPLDKRAFLWYIITMRATKNMKEKTDITEASLLLNQQVIITSHMSRFTGRIGHVNAVMPDGHTLDVDVEGVGDVFLDVTLVSEVRDVVGGVLAGEQSLGPDANSVLPNNRL